MDSGLIPTALVILGSSCAILLAFRYRAAITRALFAPPRPPEAGEPVVVAEADGELGAQLMRSQLEAAGIGAYVRNASSLAYVAGYPFQRWEIRVRYADLEAAREALGMPSGDEEYSRS